MLTLLQSLIGSDMSKSPSPLGSWLNGVVMAAEKGIFAVEFTVREEMLNPAKILHGGALTAMMDEVMGISVATLGNESFYSTINIQVDFLSACQLGEKILVKSEVMREGKTIINTACTVTKTDGKLVARGGSNLLRK
ncbi:MAG: hypothetical protein RL711_778 [Bacteroidota bacterium]